MEKRYKALRTIGSIYKILGGIAGVLTVLSMIAFCGMSVFGGAMFDMFNSNGPGGMPGMFSGALGGIFMALGALVTGGAASVTLYAMGEGVYLLIDLEENTRETNAILRARKKASSEGSE